MCRGDGWAAVVGPEEGRLQVGGPHGPPLAEESRPGASSLDGRAVAARRRWRDGGGRRRLGWLRRWEIDEGREADSRGRWRVARVVGVRRPERRLGRQLEVQVEWAGVDASTGEAWGVEWVPLAWCTADVRAEARRLEEAAFPRPRAATPATGSRKSPRWATDGGGGAEQRAEEGGSPASAAAERPSPVRAHAALGPRCPGGHRMSRCCEGSAGLVCDGGCGRRIRRGEGWWGCVQCDFDVCDVCCDADGGDLQ